MMFGIGLLLITAGVLVIVYAMQGKSVFNFSHPTDVGPWSPPRPMEPARPGG